MTDQPLPRNGQLYGFLTIGSRCIVLTASTAITSNEVDKARASGLRRRRVGGWQLKSVWFHRAFFVALA
jgi:hypothetical protein